MTDEAQPAREQERRGPGLVGWSLVVLFILLAIFYGWRTESNRAQLTERNLRELDRIGRALEGRVGSYALILRGLAGRDTALVDTLIGKRLLPGLVRRASCAEKPDGVSVLGNALQACYAVRPWARRPAPAAAARAQPALAKGGGPAVVGGVFSLDPLRQMLDTLLFDVSFVADSDNGVFLLSTRGSGVRIRAIPADSSKEAAGPASRVRPVTIGGRGYLMFLQPLAVQPAASAGASPMQPRTWWLGGLVSTARFRGESLALDPPHLVFLGLLMLLVLLSLPYLRVALMGPAESVRVSDVHLLSLALMLAGGVLGVAIADVYFSGTYTATLDHNLVAAGDRLAGAYHDEVGRALRELDRWAPPFDSLRRRSPDALNDSSILARRPAGLLQEPYPALQMIVWVQADGTQAGKWTVRARNTFAVGVADRGYFRRIVDDSAFTWREGPGSPPVPYALESINSLNTGERLAAISVPYCWDLAVGAGRPPGGRLAARLACPDSLRGAQVLLTRPLSLDRPVLPPGVQFAVVDPTGATLFHSDPERELAENFLEETGRNPLLGAALTAQGVDTLDATYMGRRSRLYVRPLEGTPYSLVLVLDKSLAGTARFESVFTSLLIFFAFELMLWLVIVAVEHVLPGHLRWAWPVLGHGPKYVRLTWLLAAFGLVLLIEAVGAATLRIPVHPGAFMVPLQALAVALLVQSAGIGPWWGRPRRWADPRAIGWVLLAFVTGVQVGTHLTTWTDPVWFDALVGVLEFTVAAASAWAVLRLPQEEDLRRSVAFPYVAAGVGIILVVAVLPAYLLHQEAFSAHEERLVRFEQAEWQAQLRERTYRLQARAREGQLPAGAEGLLLAQSLDLAVPPVFGARWQGNPPQPCAPPRSELQDQVFFRVHALVPFVTPAAVAMRDVGDSLDGRAWQRCPQGLVQLAAARDTLRSALAVGLRDIRPSWLGMLLLLIGGGLAAFYWLVRWVARRVFLLDLPALVPLYLRDAGANGNGGAGPGTADHLLVVCTAAFRPDVLASDPENHYLDLRDAGDRGRLPDVAKVPLERTVVLDHVDDGLRDDASGRAALLSMLEELADQHGRKLVLMTGREPGMLFPLDGPATASADPTPERWTRLLGQFVKISAAGVERPPAEAMSLQPATGVAAGAGEDRPRSGIEAALERRLKALEERVGYASWPEWARAHIRISGGFEPPTGASVRLGAGARAALAEECPPEHPQLTEVGREIARRYEVDALSIDGVLDQVRESADPYYRALWAGLEKEEKLVVAQLAANVVVNPKSRRAVRRLLARSVLVRKPELRLMNQSFARFVREEVPEAAIRAWEQEVPDSPWQRLRFPIILALAIVAAFLFATQRETFDTVLAIVTGVGVAATAVFRLVGGFSGGKQ